MENPKPCPFCGGVDIEICVNSVLCVECGGMIINDDLTEEEVIESWNTRHEA